MWHASCNLINTYKSVAQLSPCEKKIVSFTSEIWLLHLEKPITNQFSTGKSGGIMY